MPTSVLLRLVLSSAVISAILGGIFAQAAHCEAVVGVVLGAVFGATFPALEAFVFQGRVGPDLRRLPFLIYLALRSGAYVVVIVAIKAVGARFLSGPQRVSLVDIAFALGMSVAGNLIFGMSELLGPGVLFAFAVGRYHRPRREERALLFIDLTGSTAAAERLGEERFLDFLSAFIADVSHAIVENRGEIHKYVGDEIIATWRLGSGRADPGIVRACFAAHDRLAARRETYRREFGVNADFRAALHGGGVIVGEIGTYKKEIALIGDAMNTTARILDACRDSGRPVLASATLLERLADLPVAIAAEPLKPIALRGKSARLAVFALESAKLPTLPGAALHGGSIVLGEVGSVKKEIALIGDAMNTTARILDACRDSGRSVLASAALLERLAELPAAVAVQPMAPLTLRGKSAPLKVYALERGAMSPPPRRPE